MERKQQWKKPMLSFGGPHPSGPCSNALLPEQAGCVDLGFSSLYLVGFFTNPRLDKRSRDSVGTG